MGRNGSKRLLLVEDDRPLADLVKYHFDREGFTVTSTSAGDEAMILVDEIKPDLVILDWMIEGISGIEVCRRLRRNPATKGLPILMLTARGDEDDRPLADLVKYHFDREGFTVTSTSAGDEAMILVDEIKPDLVILDWMIEGISGIEVCRRLRRNPATKGLPILMLTARGDEDDRVRGLETGADDFVTKPFSPKELIARANALLRRSRPELSAKKLSYHGIEMDLVAHRVRRDGKPVALGPTEYRLLRHFLENPQRVFSREQLLEAVWPHNHDIELRTVDVHIRRLRMALTRESEIDLLRTVRSEGYSLDADGAA